MSKQVGTILGVKAPSSFILVEMLSAEEMLNTKLYLGGSTNTDAGTTPQGYVLDIGPSVESEKLGFVVGDRVVIQGKYIPIPKPSNQKRELGIIDIYAIKAILNETDDN